MHDTVQVYFLPLDPISLPIGIVTGDLEVFTMLAHWPFSAALRLAVPTGLTSVTDSVLIPHRR